MTDDIFPRFTVASWTVGGRKLAFPVVNIAESGGNRIIERERPFRDGAKLDDTGSKATRWVMTVLFENSIREPGLEVNNEPLYPGVLNSLIQSVLVHETGTLVVPTIGPQRARLESYNRTESSDQRDAAQATFTFVEDNEDAIDFRIIEEPTVNANARRLAEQTTFDAQSLGSWDQTLSDLERAVSDMEDLSNAPFDAAADLETNAIRVRELGKRSIQVFSNAGRPGRDQFGSARANRAERKILRERDMAGRATADSRRGRPQLQTVVFGADLTLFDVAGVLKQSFADLADVNPRLNPFFIPKLTPVNVFVTPELTAQEA